mmetsp:Transcript_19423/g.35143  ORF Transcript_19423/g.35143 Transcript_19423/m.35143 type:complete len:212 (-) Transcript_19423:776-1411(-)
MLFLHRGQLFLHPLLLGIKILTILLTILGLGMPFIQFLPLTLQLRNPLDIPINKPLLLHTPSRQLAFTALLRPDLRIQQIVLFLKLFVALLVVGGIPLGGRGLGNEFFDTVGIVFREGLLHDLTHFFRGRTIGSGSLMTIGSFIILLTLQRSVPLLGPFRSTLLLGKVGIVHNHHPRLTHLLRPNILLPQFRLLSLLFILGHGGVQLLVGG